jgi:heptosyltransferase III
MPQILLLRRGGLGDTLLMLPVLRALRRAHPAAELHFAGVLEFAAVLQQHGACDRARSSEDLALWSPVAAHERLRDYALVVTDDPAVAVAARAATEVRTFDPRPRGSAPIGAQIAAQLQLSLRWPEDAWLCAPASAPGPGSIALAPGSGGRAKCWPQERWLELAAPLANERRPLLVVVGPTELERDDPRRWPWPAAMEFVVEAQVTALAARLKVAAAFVGNDSGTTHLAAMLGVPTVALFGPSDARVWAPQGGCVRVLVAGAALAGMPPAPVLQALRDLSVFA